MVEGPKCATALVEIPMYRNKKVFGTAFCIDSSGLFVTNAHVADAGNGKIRLILSPNEADQRIVPATVLRSEHEMDLAFLQIDGVTNLKTLELGDASTLFDTMDLTAFGYPFGGAWPSKHRIILPSASVPGISLRCEEGGAVGIDPG